MRSVSASPRVAGCALDPDTRRTARSASGSAPTTSKRDCSPVVNSALPPSAYATTWALVSISPSGVNTTPEPAPSPRRLRTVRLATLGSTVVATVDTTRLYASRASVSWSRSMSGGNAGTSAVDAVPGFAQREAGAGCHDGPARRVHRGGPAQRVAGDRAAQPGALAIRIRPARSRCRPSRPSSRTYSRPASPPRWRTVHASALLRGHSDSYTFGQGGAPLLLAERHFARKWTTWQASTRVQGVAGRSPPVRSRVRAATAAYPGRYAARSWSPRYVATATTSRTWTRCATRAPGGRSTGWAAGTSGTAGSAGAAVRAPPDAYAPDRHSSGRSNQRSSSKPADTAAPPRPSVHGRSAYFANSSRASARYPGRASSPARVWCAGQRRYPSAS